MKLTLLAAALLGSILMTKCTAEPDLRIITPERLAVRAGTVTPAQFTVALKDIPVTAPTFTVELLGGSKPKRIAATATAIDTRNYVVSAKLPGLSEGSYEAHVLQGALRSSTPAILFATPVYRRPARLRSTGNLIWRGRPFFPIGLYHVDPTDAEYAMLAANGFNSVQGSFNQNLDGFRQSLDLALAHNLAVQVPLYANNLVKANLSASIEKMRATAAHPAVLSWKILDEPDADQNAAVRGEVTAAYLALKKVNRVQPMELTLSDDETLGFWTRSADLVQIDRYPLPGHALTQVSDFCDAAVRAKEKWQNLTFVVQCGYTPDLSTQPSFDQARAMVYLALISGAKGISWYSRQEDNWDLTTSPLWPRMKEINAEISALSQPLLLGRDVLGIRCSEPSVHFVAKRSGSQLYLLATNPSANAVSAIFTVPASVRVRHAMVQQSGAALAFTDRTLQVPLGAIDSATIVFSP